MKDKPESITLGKGHFVYWPDADEYGRLPQKAVTRHPHITCPRCDCFYKSGGGDNLGLRYKCSRCGLEWYREEDFEFDKEYLLSNNKDLPKQIIIGLWIYKLERRCKKSQYVKYVKKNKLMKEKKYKRKNKWK